MLHCPCGGRDIRCIWILQIRKILSLENVGLLCVHFRLNSTLLLQGFTVKMSSEADVVLRSRGHVKSVQSLSVSVLQMCSWCVWCAVAWQATAPEAFGSGVGAVGRVLQCHRMGALARALSGSVLFTSLSWTGTDQEELCASVEQPAVFPCRDFTSVCIAWCKQKCSILMHLELFK